MRKFYVRAGSFVALVILLSSVLTPLASAATPNNPTGAFNVVVSPITVNLETKPGGTTTTNLQVKNQGLDTEHVKINILKFGAYGQDGTPKLLDVKPNDDSVNWITFSTPKFDAEPNVWKTVKMTVSPPKTAAFGYYYAVVFSRDGAEKQIQQKKSNLLGAVASLVLVEVQAPGAVKHASISEFSTSNKVFEFLPAKFTVRMRNSGNVHVAPRGNIFITRGGKQIALLEVNLPKGNILPNSSRKFTADWQDGTPVYKQKVVDNKVVMGKNGKPVNVLDWSNFNASKLRFGKYNARVVMVYDDGRGDISTEAKLSFWVIPWRVIGVSLIVLLFVVAGTWALLIRPIRRRLQKSRGNARLR